MAAPTVDKIVAEAKRFLGVPYKWGGTTPSGFDCSGFVQYVYRQLGVTLPRTSEEQYAATERITAAQLQPGDLVFSEPSSSGPGHVGMYVGIGPLTSNAGGKYGQTQVATVIEAPHTGEDVKYLALSEFGASGYGRVKSIGSIPTTPAGVAENAAAGLLQFPQSIINWAKQSTDDATKAFGWFDEFFQPKTYVRVGAGLFGMMFLGAGLVTLLLAAKEA